MPLAEPDEQRFLRWLLDRQPTLGDSKTRTRMAPVCQATFGRTG